jgi:Ca2+-binding EF-hand superfamily protein
MRDLLWCPNNREQFIALIDEFEKDQKGNIGLQEFIENSVVPV